MERIASCSLPGKSSIIVIVNVIFGLRLYGKQIADFKYYYGKVLFSNFKTAYLIQSVTDYFACPPIITILNNFAHLSLSFIPGTTRLVHASSSSGVNRTKKGRLLFSRRTVGRSSTIGNSRKLASSRTAGSHPSTIFQTASTQTDMRDSEIQTDPWWHRSEGIHDQVRFPCHIICYLPQLRLCVTVINTMA